MSDNTKIEWSDASWNPVTGCTKVSAGCDNCYAETFAERFRGVLGHHFEQGFDVVLRPERLDQPLRWKRPRRIFVNSMSDLFHEKIPDEYIARVFAVMALAPRHTFQILTKRHGRMRSLLTSPGWRGMCEDAYFAVNHEAHNAGAIPRFRFSQNRDKWWSDFAEPLRNVWLGVSVEDQKWADIRIPALLDTPATVRWISAEPLLGPVDLSRWLGTLPVCGCGDNHGAGCSAECMQHEPPGLGWVVAGGESGREARPMSPAWARGLRDQCAAAGVPFLFKQWGEWAPTGQVGIGCIDPRERLAGQPDERGYREVIRRVGKKTAGRELDGRVWDEYPVVA